MQNTDSTPVEIKRKLKATKKIKKRKVGKKGPTKAAVKKSQGANTTINNTIDNESAGILKETLSVGAGELFSTEERAAGKETTAKEAGGKKVTEKEVTTKRTEYAESDLLTDPAGWPKQL